MEEVFDVLLEGKTVGTVTLERQGLYVHVRCRCSAPGDKIWRLFGGNRRLGVLVPQGNRLVLETKVAAKNLEPGAVFVLGDSPVLSGERFVPIAADALLPELHRVRQSVFVCRNGVPGLIFREAL